jgi:hypothetical protein
MLTGNSNLPPGVSDTDIPGNRLCDIQPDNQRELRQMLDDLLALDEGLTNWEMDFIDSLHNWKGCFTEKQADRLSAIWNKLC